MYVALADLYVHDQDLNSAEFRQLMLCLVQDVYTKPGVSRSAPDINFRDEFFNLSFSPPAVDVINNFVTLATSASAPIAPPVAILGLTYTFVNWVSTTTLENAYAPPLPIPPIHDLTLS